MAPTQPDTTASRGTRRSQGWVRAPNARAETRLPRRFSTLRPRRSSRASGATGQSWRPSPTRWKPCCSRAASSRGGTPTHFRALSRSRSSRGAVMRRLAGGQDPGQPAAHHLGPLLLPHSMARSPSWAEPGRTTEQFTLTDSLTGTRPGPLRRIGALGGLLELRNGEPARTEVLRWLRGAAGAGVPVVRHRQGAGHALLRRERDPARRRDHALPDEPPSALAHLPRAGRPSPNAGSSRSSSPTSLGSRRSPRVAMPRTPGSSSRGTSNCPAT